MKIDDEKQGYDDPQQAFALVIPAEIAFDQDLNIVEIVLWGFIWNSCNRHGKCWAGNKYLAKMCRCSVPTITRSIKKLHDLGYITTAVHTTDRGSERLIMLHPMIRGVSSQRLDPPNHSDEYKYKQRSINKEKSIQGGSNQKRPLSIEERKTLWLHLLWHNHHRKYRVAFLVIFAAYWTEAGEKDKKMKFEKLKSFDVGRRLATFERNNYEGWEPLRIRSDDWIETMKSRNPEGYKLTPEDKHEWNRQQSLEMFELEYNEHTGERIRIKEPDQEGV